MLHDVQGDDGVELVMPETLPCIPGREGEVIDDYFRVFREPAVEPLTIVGIGIREHDALGPPSNDVRGDVSNPGPDLQDSSAKEGRNALELPTVVLGRRRHDLQRLGTPSVSRRYSIRDSLIVHPVRRERIEA
jgi:hypothetical protein